MSLSPRAEPFVWIHLAGLATVPFWAALFLFAIANPEPFLPAPVTAILAGILGIGSVLWMQLRRPFYIFSLPSVVLKPAALQENQRRLLPWFLSSLSQILAIATAIILSLILNQLYHWLPIVQLQNPLAWIDSFLAFVLAIVAVLAISLFTQVPVSVARLLLLSEQAIATTEPLAPGQIAQRFTILGLPLGGLLPAAWYDRADLVGTPDEAQPEPQPEAIATESESSLEAVATASEPNSSATEPTTEPEATVGGTEQSEAEATIASTKAETTETPDED